MPPRNDFSDEEEDNIYEKRETRIIPQHENQKRSSQADLKQRPLETG